MINITWYSSLSSFFLRANEMDDIDEPQTDFIYCCGALTEVLKFGSCQSLQKVLFLIIPGRVG